MKNRPTKFGLALLLGLAVSSAAYAFQVYGAIGDKYTKLNRERGPLGQALTDEAAASFGGRFNQFQNGFIYWHPQTGAFAVWGSIGQKWDQLGRVSYGYPITDESVTPDGRGRYNHFRAMQTPAHPEASIYWTPQTGAHAVYGAIRDKWASIGWERSPLGYPTTDEMADGAYRRTDFERGFIRWSASGGAEVFPVGDVTGQGGFGTLLVNGIEVVADAPSGTGTIPIISNNHFLSAVNLCGMVQDPPPPLPNFNQLLKSLVPVANAQYLSGSPFKIRSDISGAISHDCHARSDVVSAAGGNINSTVILPGNKVTLYLTTPDVHVGPLSIGAPGSVDPKASVTFDIAARTTILIPAKACSTIGLGTTNISVTNVQVHGENLTGDVALFTANVIKFFTGHDFLKGLTDNRFIPLQGITTTLQSINPKLCNAIPPNARIDQSYNSNASTLVLRATLRAPDRGPVVR
jgi:hypothetical protein